MENPTPERVLKWADLLAERTGQFQPPVDLLKAAKSVDVKLVRMQLMFPRGATIAVDGGFEIYLRGLQKDGVDLSAGDHAELLTTRQRFTLAHEIAHTAFYRHLKTKTRPKPTQPFKDIRDLEELCDSAASRILVPTKMLQKEIREHLGSPERIDVPFVLDEVMRFRVSPETLIERLRWVARSNFPRCIVFARRKPQGVEVAGFYFGAGLISIIPEPRKYSSLVTWFKSFPAALLDDSGDREYRINLAGNEIALERVRWGERGDFFLKVDQLPPTQATEGPATLFPDH